MAGPEIMGIMMLGTAVQAVGAIGQANAAKGAHKYNAELREQDAQVALEQAAVDAFRVGQQGRQAQGELAAGIGASGGSAEDSMDVIRMSAANAKLDQETVMYKGRLKATGYYNDARLERQAGVVAERQGYLNAASSILTGAGQAGATYVAGQRNVRLTRTASAGAGDY